MKRPRTQQFLLFSLLTLVISAGTLALVDADDLVRLSRNVPGESTPIIVDADEITTWVDGNVHVMLLRGQVLVQHGIVRARFAEGVLLIDARHTRKAASGTSISTPREMSWSRTASTRSGSGGLVDLHTRGELKFNSHKSKVLHQAQPNYPLYRRALAQRAAAQDSPGNSASSSNPAIRFWEDHARNVPDGKTIQPPLAPVGMTPGSGANTPRPAFYTPAAPSPPLSSTLAPSPSAAAPSDSATLIVPVQASMPVNAPAIPVPSLPPLSSTQAPSPGVAAPSGSVVPTVPVQASTPMTTPVIQVPPVPSTGPLPPDATAPPAPAPPPGTIPVPPLPPLSGGTPGAGAPRPQGLLGGPLMGPAVAGGPAQFTV